jgi:hypothetical protein
MPNHRKEETHWTEKEAQSKGELQLLLNKIYSHLEKFSDRPILLRFVANVDTETERPFLVLPIRSISSAYAM